ncbi:hypothetical protein J3E69DRAFT_342183 [Trichoderma sp. SZMC 28015]
MSGGSQTRAFVLLCLCLGWNLEAITSRVVRPHTAEFSMVLVGKVRLGGGKNGTRRHPGVSESLPVSQPWALSRIHPAILLFAAL